MNVSVKLAFDEQAAVRLLNWLARENATILRARPDLPGLYASGVRYKREPDEIWCDYLTLLAMGHEDCDGLAAARAGGGFFTGLGLACLAMAQPFLYLGLGAAWILAAFGRFLSAAFDGAQAPRDWLLAAFAAVLGIMPLAFVLGYVG